MAAASSASPGCRLVYQGATSAPYKSAWESMRLHPGFTWFCEENRIHRCRDLFGEMKSREKDASTHREIEIRDMFSLNGVVRFVCEVGAVDDISYAIVNRNQDFEWVKLREVARAWFSIVKLRKSKHPSKSTLYKPQKCLPIRIVRMPNKEDTGGTGPDNATTDFCGRAHEVAVFYDVWTKGIVPFMLSRPRSQLAEWCARLHKTKHLSGYARPVGLTGRGSRSFPWKHPPPASQSDHISHFQHTPVFVDVEQFEWVLGGIHRLDRAHSCSTHPVHTVAPKGTTISHWYASQNPTPDWVAKKDVEARGESIEGLQRRLQRSWSNARHKVQASIEEHARRLKRREEEEKELIAIRGDALEVKNRERCRQVVQSKIQGVSERCSQKQLSLLINRDDGERNGAFPPAFRASLSIHAADDDDVDMMLSDDDEDDMDESVLQEWTGERP